MERMVMCCSISDEYDYVDDLDVYDIEDDMSRVGVSWKDFFTDEEWEEMQRRSAEWSEFLKANPGWIAPEKTDDIDLPF